MKQSAQTYSKPHSRHIKRNYRTFELGLPRVDQHVVTYICLYKSQTSVKLYIYICKLKSETDLVVGFFLVVNLNKI